MNSTVSVIIGFSIIFLATALGAAFSFFFKNKEYSPKVNSIITGFSGGVMLSACIFSLLVPALNYEASYMPSYWIVVIGVIVGALFLYLVDKLLPHLHIQENEEEGVKAPNMSKNIKLFLAVTIHNVPEGLAVGVAYGVAIAAAVNGAENANALLYGALVLAIGIGIQNIPEGTMVSLPIQRESGSSTKAFLYGTLSGAVEPIAALLGLLLSFSVAPLMPWALSFAAGAMLYVIVEEVVPDAHSDPISHYGVFSFLIGFLLMMVLDSAL